MEINVNVNLDDKTIAMLEKLIGMPISVEQNVVETVPMTDSQSGNVPVEAPIEEKVESVPTEEPAYTFEQIQLACANLARSGKRDVLASLINDFSLNSLMDLKEGQYNEFALKLREVGGTI